MRTRDHRTTRNATKLGAAGFATLSVVLCAALAMPAAVGCGTWNYFDAYADQEAHKANKSGKSSKFVSKLRHVHKKIKVPISSNLKSYASGQAKASYYYVCSCGKKFKETYTYGYTWTSQISELSRRYANKPTGGIAFTGSSLFSRWDSLAADLENAYGYPADKIYNMAIGGMGARRWVQDDYVDAIAALKPSVVVVSGVNSLRCKDMLDLRTDSEAAQETVDLVETYIAKLRKKLPGVKVLIVAGIKTPADYGYADAKDMPPVNWDRIDEYNRLLKKRLGGYKNVRCIDIQRYLMADFKNNGSKQLGFYCSANRLMKASSLKTAQKIVNKKRNHDEFVDPYVRKDLRHPTALSYTKVWTPYVGSTAVNMARSASKVTHAK